VQACDHDIFAAMLAGPGAYLTTIGVKDRRRKLLQAITKNDREHEKCDMSPANGQKELQMTNDRATIAYQKENE
jgi:hypothetical protein